MCVRLGGLARPIHLPNPNIPEDTYQCCTFAVRRSMLVQQSVVTSAFRSKSFHPSTRKNQAVQRQRSLATPSTLASSNAPAVISTEPVGEAAHMERRLYLLHSAASAASSGHNHTLCPMEKVRSPPSPDSTDVCDLRRRARSADVNAGTRSSPPFSSASREQIQMWLSESDED
jgi:hypothetical protein|eukprot:scaffold27777_cov129-Isochrysis_galbana.AAC.10